MLMAGLTVSLGHAEPITTGTLVRELTDLHRLADFPRPAYKTVQFSSYDRTSDLPGGPGWFANNDGFGGEDTPNFVGVVKEPGADGIGEYLICDVEGPGAIVRTWTAVMAGSLRLYLDGAAEPLYDGSADEFMRCPYRTFLAGSGLDEDLFHNSMMQRDAAYCPIPFARRCRIVWIGRIQDVHFYHVGVRLYEPGTQLQTFKPKDIATYADVIRAAAAVLADPSGKYAYRSTAPPSPISATIGPGERKEVLALEGPRAIERLTLKLSADDIDKALRQTILHVICDEYPHGQVQAPVGDFFGAAPGINPMDTLPFTIAPDGTMTCRYVMPFAKSVKIVLENRGAQTVTATGDVLAMDYAWNDGTSMHFRARWRVDHDIVGHDPMQDMPILIANGGGVYVGTAVYLLNPCGPPTPSGGWWGEGDEKVFIDDDTFPSTFGTGSEDYFNYSWSVPDIFYHAYCGQPRDDGPGNRGFVTNFRWHIIDAMPFTQRLSFYLELMTHERTPGMSYARIGYHYARPGLMDDHVTITDEDVRPLALPANWQPAARGGARHTTFFEPEDLVQPGARTRSEEGNLWSGSRLLVWEPKDVGDKISFRLPVAESGRYALVLGLALDSRAGTISVQVDGKDVRYGDGDNRGEAGNTLDLHDPYRVLLRHFAARPIDLSPGDHTLTLRCESLSKASDPTAFGIDYVGLQRR
jgi:hypothetical protein